MKSFFSVAMIVLSVVLLVGGFFYVHSMFAVPSVALETTSASPVTAQQLNDSNTTIQTYLKTVKINGAVPLSVDSMSRNPDPLFSASQ